MGRHARGSSPPCNGRDKAEEKVNPNSRNSSGNSCPLASDHPNLGSIADETGRKIHKAKRHFFNGGTEMFSHETVSSFVDHRHSAKQKPKLDQVHSGLVHEVVLGKTIGPY